MKIHPVADLLPMIEGEEWRDFLDNIRSKGQQVSIKTLDGMILDGRNQHRACMTLGIEPKYEPLPDDTDPVAYVVTHNIARRHMNAAQKAAFASQVANLCKGSNRFDDKVEGRIRPSTLSESPSESAISLEQAAKMTGAAVRSVKSMKRVMRDGVPELTEEVKKGNLSIRQAEQIAALPKVEQNDAIAQATVRPDRALIQPPDKGGLVDPADDDDSPW